MVIKSRQLNYSVGVRAPFSDVEPTPENTNHLSFAVIMARYKNRWVFVRHKNRSTFEIPGGRREQNESILETAKRELFEETGASLFNITPIETYTVHFQGSAPSSSGLLCYAEIDEMNTIPESEIQELQLFESPPANLTYPQIQPHLFKRAADKTQLIQKLAPYKHIIWDWNGTLIDDVELAVKSIGVLLAENNLPLICKNKYKEVFGFPIKNYYEKIGFDLNKCCFNKLSDRFHEEYNRYRPEHAQLFKDVTWNLEFLRRNRKQSILSAAAQWHLDDWVKYYEIDHHFDHIFGIDNHFATSKLERGRELMEVSGVDPKDSILIGDTDHDRDVANELGIDVLLIADGHQSHEKLLKIHHNVLETRFAEGR